MQKIIESLLGLGHEVNIIQVKPIVRIETTHQMGGGINGSGT